MVSGIVGLPAPLLNDEPFRPTPPSRYLGVHIVFSIHAVRQPPLAIVKESTSDIARGRSPVTILDELENVSGPLEWL
jgi:hypothetical protein